MAGDLRKRLRYYSVFAPLSRLPLAWAYAGAAGVGRYDRYRAGSGRQAVAGAIRRVFGAQCPPEQARAWADAQLAMMARETLDVFTLPRFTPDSIERLVRLDSIEPLRAARADGRGVILVMAHYSRLNMLLLALALAGERLGMLTMAIDEGNPWLGPVDRRFLQHKVHGLLGRLGGRWVTLGGSMRGLYEGLSRGETIVILLDAVNPPGVKGARYPFLGGELEVARGIPRLARRTGARLVYGTVREQGWRLRGEVRSLPEDPEDGLAAAVAELERDVRAAPDQWWQWGALDHLWRPRPTC